MGIPQVIQDPIGAIVGSAVPEPFYIGGIEVDVTLLEKKSLRYTVSKHPVEAGLDITDNRYKEPLQVRIEGEMTDTPIGLDAVLATAITAATGGAGFQLLTWRDKKEALEAVADSNEVIDIVGRLDVYLDMTLTLVDVSETPNTAGYYPFTIEAEESRQVSSEIVSVDPSQIPKSIRDLETAGQKEARGKVSKPAKKGAKQTKKATEKDIDPLRGTFEGLGIDTSGWKASG